MLNLAEYRQRPALLADWLPWAGLVAPGVVLNKDGSFQRTAKFRGPDLDSAVAAELVAVAERLRTSLDTQTFLARLGGDEFAVIAAGEAARERVAADLGDEAVDQRRHRQLAAGQATPGRIAHRGARAARR